MIFIVGMMGSGKSSVGRRLGGEFLDLDEEIEKAAGKRVAEIFASEGEARFRDLERAALARVAARGAGTVALGGGAVLDERNRRAIREAAGSRVIWLRAAPEALAERVGDGDERPLLAGLDAAGRARRLAELLRQREPLYDEVADEVIDTTGRPLDAVVEEVERSLRGRRAIDVALGERSYRVEVEPGGLGRLGRRMRRAGLRPGRCALVTDENVAGLPWLARAADGLRDAGFAPATTVVPPGEDAKSLDVVDRLLSSFAAAKLERGSCVVALGGGAVTDVAGFAAAIYLRGVPWVAVPTTLLGMVDAAIGGKTGLNLAAGKNLAGAFHQPRLVLCDTDALATLPAREVRSGMGEVLKYALIGPPELCEAVCSRSTTIASGPECSRSTTIDADLVARCAEVKARVVSRDERETSGERKVLNFGHTLGHAVEAASGYAIAHGDAVVLGMRAALHLSRAKGLMDGAEHARLIGLLERTGVPRLGPEADDASILAHLAHDKKLRDGRLLFVLLRRAGEPAIDVEVARDELPAAIAAMRGGDEP